MRKSALFLSSYESEPLEWIVFQTGIELEPGRHLLTPARRTCSVLLGRAEPDTHTGRLGELFNDA